MRPPRLPNADVAWVTFDTPVDENDVPQVVAVVEPVKGFLPHVPDECLVLVSAQLPVGTTRRFGLQWANLNDTDNSVGNGPRQLLLSQCLLRIKAHGTRKER
jgi:UDPglucose 6-dehydrogenase